MYNRLTPGFSDLPRPSGLSHRGTPGPEYKGPKGQWQTGRYGKITRQ